jgi:hypothetical protein
LIRQLKNLKDSDLRMAKSFFEILIINKKGRALL